MWVFSPVVVYTAERSEAKILNFYHLKRLEITFSALKKTFLKQSSKIYIPSQNCSSPGNLKIHHPSHLPMWRCHFTSKFWGEMTLWYPNSLLCLTHTIHRHTWLTDCYNCDKFSILWETINITMTLHTLECPYY